MVNTAHSGATYYAAEPDAEKRGVEKRDYTLEAHCHVLNQT